MPIVKTQPLTEYEQNRIILSLKLCIILFNIFGYDHNLTQNQIGGENILQPAGIIPLLKIIMLSEPMQKVNLLKWIPSNTTFYS